MNDNGWMTQATDLMDTYSHHGKDLGHTVDHLRNGLPGATWVKTIRPNDPKHQDDWQDIQWGKPNSGFMPASEFHELKSSLVGLLRLHGPLPRHDGGYELETNSGGWMRMADVAYALNHSYYDVLSALVCIAPCTLEGGRLFSRSSLVPWDRKLEFVRAATDVAFPWMDIRRWGSPVQNQHAAMLSTVCHTTSVTAVLGIIRFGFLPGGGGLSEEDRPIYQFTPFRSCTT